MTGERERMEDALESMLSGKSDGAAPGSLDETGELAALGAVAGEMRILNAAVPPSSGAAALAAMTSELETARMAGEQTGLIAAIAAWWKRPAMRTGAAVTAAVLVVGGVGLSAAAASGNEPVRSLLGLSTESAIKVELKGTIVSVSGPVLEVDANGDVRTVIINDDTELRGDDDSDLPLDALVPGLVVEVEGRLQPDDTIIARVVSAEDDDDDDATPTAGAPTEPAATEVPPTQAPPTAVPTSPPAPTVPAAQPTIDDDDDQGEDNDDQGDDDNSGPGSGDDDADDDDSNSGPGSGDDDADDDDSNSGPGSGGDDDDDDSTGGGSGSSDDDDDESDDD